jgi:hypothetical protein
VTALALRRGSGAGNSLSVQTRGDAANGLDQLRLAFAGGEAYTFNKDGNLLLGGDPVAAKDAATKQYVDGLLDNEYESAEIAVTLGGSGSVAHDLGGFPFYFQAFARCIVADRGWSVGDELLLDYGMDSLSGYGIQLAATATHIKWQFGGNALVLPNAAGQSGAATITSWRVIIRARR